MYRLKVLSFVWAALVLTQGDVWAQRIRVDPTRGMPLTPVLATGCGWAPGPVEILWDDGIHEDSLEADARGCLDDTYEVPLITLPGWHRILARQGGKEASAWFNILLLPPFEVSLGRFRNLDPRWRDSSQNSLDLLEARSRRPVDIRFHGGFPRTVSAEVETPGDDPVEVARNFLETYSGLYGQQSRAFELVASRFEPAFRGTQTVSFRQTLGGTPVFGGEIVVFVDDNTVFGTAGALLTGRPVVSLTPQIERERAERLALAAQLNGHPDEVPDPKVLGRTHLLVYEPTLHLHGPGDAGDPDPHLVWHVALENPGVAVLVDALSGETIVGYPLAQGHHPQTTVDALNENVQTNGCHSTPDHTVLAPSHASGDPEEEDAADNFGFIYDLYDDDLGRESWNDEHNEIFVAVHSSTAGTASWSPGCAGFEFTNGSAVPDIVSHEFTHAVISSASGLIYANESGALNESLADIMGAITDRNWTVGEQMGNPFRSLQDPPSQSSPLATCGGFPITHPDRYSDYVVLPNTQACDWGGVHINSGIHNKAAYLMTEGDVFRGAEVAGFEGNKFFKLSQLMYKLQTTLSSTADLTFAAAVANLWAERFYEDKLHGFTKADVCNVRNAYAAVELAHGADADCDGTPDPLEADPDGDGQVSDNCPLVKNASQSDIDQDGIGDACDEDADGDGVPNVGDNCPAVANAPPNDGDADGDGIGDACDDFDGDGIPDHLDRCPNAYDPTNNDTDKDTVGDVCDPDIDGDGKVNGDDNCPYDVNPGQEDADQGGLGDACDPNPDNPFDDYILRFGKRLGLQVADLDRKSLYIDLCSAGCPEDWLLDQLRVVLTLKGLENGRAWVTNLRGSKGITPVDLSPARGEPLRIQWVPGDLGGMVLHLTGGSPGSNVEVELSLQGR